MQSSPSSPSAFARRARRGLALLAATASTALLLSTARAADEDLITPKVIALEASVTAHTNAKDVDGLKEDVTTAKALYDENAKKDPNRDRILRVVGGLSRRPDDAGRAAITLIGDLGDPSGSRYLRPFFRPINDKSPAPFGLDLAFASAKKVPDESLVEPLLSMVDDSDDYSAAAKAMDTLGGFGTLKRSREKILERLLKSVLKSKSGHKMQNLDNLTNPDAGTGNSMGQTPAARWKVLSEALPTALNQLTGQREPTTESWSDLAARYKGRLRELFNT
jgi:hypothetical protein